MLQLIIEEKENMDTAKAEAVDSEHLNAASGDEEKPVGKKIFCSNLQRKLHQELLSRRFTKRTMSRDTV